MDLKALWGEPVIIHLNTIKNDCDKNSDLRKWTSISIKEDIVV